MAFEWILRAIWTCCIIGILANTLVIYVAYTASGRIGSFKYLLIFFAAIEITFSIIVFFSQPFFYAYDYRLVIYSHSDIPLFAETILGKFAIGLYCSFYELWMGVVVVMFVFKYIVLCRRDIVDKVDRFWYYKLLFLAIYMLHFVYSMVCGILWCNNTVIPESVHDHIQTVLHRPDDKNYLVLTFKAFDGTFSFDGFMSAFDHVVYATLTGIISTFCGRKIWFKVKEMYEENNKDYRHNLQIFYTLVLQAAVPFVLYQIPTCLFVIDALVEQNPILTNYIPLWPLCISLPKAIDPFIILLLIKEYRLATINIFKNALNFVFRCKCPINKIQASRYETSTGHPIQSHDH